MKFALLVFSFGLLVVSQPAKPKSCVEANNQQNSAIIEWPFFLEDDDYLLGLNIASPAQPVNVSMYYFYSSTNLRILSTEHGGSYDQTKSSTYFEQGAVYNNKGQLIAFRALEHFKLGTTKLELIPFDRTVVDSFVKNYIGLGKPENNTFLDNVLNRLPQKTMVYAFDKFPDTGVLLLGGTDSKRCFRDWRLIKEIRWEDDNKWGAAIDSLSAGNFLASDPGNLLFTVYDTPLVWPKSVYYPILKEIGSTDGKTVPCSTNTSIFFNIQDVTFELTPEQYLDRDMEASKGVCLLLGTTVDDSEEYVLPRSILKDYCLSVNHYTSKIGLATRRT